MDGRMNGVMQGGQRPPPLVNVTSRTQIQFISQANDDRDYKLHNHSDRFMSDFVYSTDYRDSDSSVSLDTFSPVSLGNWKIVSCNGTVNEPFQVE